MFSNTSRTRVLVTPYQTSGAAQIKLGSYQWYNSSTKAWDLPDGIQQYTLNSLGYPVGVKGKITMDVNHGKPPYTVGGPFKSLKIDTCIPFGGVHGFGTYYRLDGRRRYVGGFRPPSNTQWGDMILGSYESTLKLNSSEFPALGDWGDKAYNKAKPKLEKASGFVATAEMSDLPRMLRTTSRGFHDAWKLAGGNSTGAVMAPKNVADHFLNHQFGWIPFLSDLDRFIDTFQHSYRYINKLADQNGYWVRKRVTLKEEETRTMIGSGTGVQLFPNTSFDSPWDPWFLPGRPATYEIWDEVQHYITAVGKFMFYRPEFDRIEPDYYSAANTIQRQLTVYGLRPSPINIYKAMPWSWAIDWISNAGDYISRANDMLMDGVAAQYLYVMQHKVRQRRFIQYLPFEPHPVKLEFVRVIETKQRDEGLSPYGFSLSFANLSLRQLAIAGALGITRS